MKAATKKSLKAVEPVVFKNLGLALTALRSLKDMSQADLARAAGLGKSQLSKYENGKELPKLESLAKALSALDSNPVAFFHVVDVLDRVEARDLSGLMLESRFAPVITEAEREAFTGLLKSTMSVFFNQVTARVLLGVRLGKRGQEPWLGETD